MFWFDSGKTLWGRCSNTVILVEGHVNSVWGSVNPVSPYDFQVPVYSTTAVEWSDSCEKPVLTYLSDVRIEGAVLISVTFQNRQSNIHIHFTQWWTSLSLWQPVFTSFRVWPFNTDLDIRQWSDKETERRQLFIFFLKKKLLLTVWKCVYIFYILMNKALLIYVLINVLIM